MSQKWEVAIMSEHPGATLRFFHEGESVYRWSSEHGEYLVVAGIDGGLSKESAIRRAFDVLHDWFVEKYMEVPYE